MGIDRYNDLLQTASDIFAYVPTFVNELKLLLDCAESGAYKAVERNNSQKRLASSEITAEHMIINFLCNDQNCSGLTSCTVFWLLTSAEFGHQPNRCSTVLPVLYFRFLAYLNDTLQYICKLLHCAMVSFHGTFTKNINTPIPIAKFFSETPRQQNADPPCWQNN
jgi:hypothetical protein